MGLIERKINEASYDFADRLDLSVRNFLTYFHEFQGGYKLMAKVGHEAQLNKSENLSGSRQNFPSNNVYAINSGDLTTATNGGSKGHGSIESYFSQVFMSFKDKYLVTLNLRGDGSSKFYKDDRWVTTYSGSIAWKIKNEKILANVKSLNDLKLRVGYGLTNNQGIRDYAYTSTLKTVTTGLSGIAQLTTKLGNKKVKWETTKNTSIGLDASLGRVEFTFDIYNRKTDGLLMQTTLPLYSGISIGWSPGSIDAPYVNIGAISNKGFEFKINAAIVQNQDFTWRSDLTFSRNTNTVVKLNTEGASINKQYSKTIVGRSIGEFYGYVVEGVFASPVDFLGDPEKGIEPHARPVKNGVPLRAGPESGSIWYGDLKFKDINEDGIIDERDQTFLGSPIPKFQLGFSNSFNYKNLDLNIFFSASYGNKVYNQMRMSGESPTSSFGYLRALNNYAHLELYDPNKPSTDIENVYVANPDTKIPGVRNDDTNGNNRVSDRFIEDGSYIKCKNISIGYRMPDRIMSRTPINSLRIFASVDNAFVFTKYKGMDPEIGSWDPFGAGIDGGFYPQSRVFTFGLTVTLNK
jgi:TonB-linked SusC/RagA family outer membrane protein